MTIRLFNVDEQTSEIIVSKAREYEADQLDTFIGEYPWEEWMEEFAPEEDWISESQAEMINSILAQGFKVAHEKKILFGGLEEYGIEVGINEDGRLYEADANDVYYAENTPENRAEFIADAERTIAEWQR